MNRKKLCKALAGVIAVSVLTTGVLPATMAYAYGGEVDVSTSTFKTDTDSSSDFQTWLSEVWSTEKSDSGKIALTPGATERDLNFAWYSVQAGTPAVRMWVDDGSTDASLATSGNAMVNPVIVEGTATEINQSNWQGSVYAASNKVSIEGYLEENTNYKYQYTDNYVGENTVWSDAEDYSTHSFSSFSAILTGDPQVGASGSSDDYSASDSSVARDTYNWNKTMESAIEKAPDAAFLLSAGDQIDKSGATKSDDKMTRESEYAGYLYPEVFRSLPIASTIGNHDTAGVDYTYHFNNPNSSEELGSTAAGSDYYFSYGDVLFISLNSNNRNQEEHRALLTEAVESNPDAVWKVVIFHSDIYGSGEPHADTDAASNRIIFAPLMDEFDIDVCLTGHDHTYSRSYQIYNGNVIDYDISDGSVTNPEGTLYITTGSGSGSKYYNLLNYTPYYIAERTNVCLPAYSVIDFTSGSLTISTYDYNGNQYADSFTIYKNDTDVTVEELEEIAADIDTTKYTEDSVNVVNAALSELEAFYEITEDEGAALASANYNTESDPLSGYGSVNADYRQVQEDGTTVNRLKKGFSTLLDKTIYTQLEGEEVSVIESIQYDDAKAAVMSAVQKLELVDGITVISASDVSTAEGTVLTDQTGNNAELSELVLIMETLADAPSDMTKKLAEEYSTTGNVLVSYNDITAYRNYIGSNSVLTVTEGTVQFKLSYPEGVTKDNSEIIVLHTINDTDDGVEMVSVTKEADGFVIEADSFSPYTIIINRTVNNNSSSDDDDDDAEAATQADTTTAETEATAEAGNTAVTEGSKAADEAEVSQTDTPQTGDSNPVILLILLAAASLTAGFVMLMEKRKIDC